MKNQANKNGFYNVNLYATLVVSELRVVLPKNPQAKAKGSLHMKGYLKSSTQNKVYFDVCVKCEEAKSIFRDAWETLPVKGNDPVKTEIVLNGCIGGAYANAYEFKDNEYTCIKGAFIKTYGATIDGELICENENCDFNQEPTLTGLVYMNHIREDEKDNETLKISGSMPEGRFENPAYHSVNLEIPKQASLLGKVSDYWPKGYDHGDTNLTYCAAVEMTDIAISTFKTSANELRASLNASIDTISYLKIGDKVAIKKGKPTFKALKDLFVEGFKEGYEKGSQPQQKQETKPAFKNKPKNTTVSANF